MITSAATRRKPSAPDGAGGAGGRRFDRRRPKLSGRLQSQIGFDLENAPGRGRGTRRFAADHERVHRHLGFRLECEQTGAAASTGVSSSESKALSDSAAVGIIGDSRSRFFDDACGVGRPSPAGSCLAVMVALKARRDPFAHLSFPRDRIPCRYPRNLSSARCVTLTRPAGWLLRAAATEQAAT